MPRRVIGIGDNVVDRYVDLGRMYPGGSACNFAVHARRLGTDAAYIGLVGMGLEGDHVVAALREENVDISRVTRYDGRQAYADVRLDAHGNREFLDWKPAPDIVVDADTLAALSKADLVHTGHSSLIEEWIPQMGTVTRVSFDFSYKDLAYAERILPHIAVATFSAADRVLEDAIALGRAAQRLGPQLVVLTRGADGAVIVHGEEVHVEPATPAGQIVDTLGAGDAFIAQLLVALLDADDIPAAAAAASQYAADACTVMGAFGHPAPIPPTGHTPIPPTTQEGTLR